MSLFVAVELAGGFEGEGEFFVGAAFVDSLVALLAGGGALLLLALGLWLFVYAASILSVRLV
ncbi:MAG: hypothetical protein GY788_21720, partial [bacterium]|nr:hypothetical protein [bacterium]